MKWISHLDMQRTVQRIIKRAGINIKYSEGFNPHMSISMAQPLSVGVESIGDYLELNEDMGINELIEAFNNNSPKGIKIVQAKKLYKTGEAKIKSSMAVLDAAKYKIKFKLKCKENIEEHIHELFNNKEFMCNKKTKSSDKLVDIRPFILEFQYGIIDDKLEVTTMLTSGSRNNLSCELLNNFIKSNIHEINEDAFVEIKRLEMYGSKEEKLVPIMEFFN